MKKKLILFLYGKLWIMCLGPLGIFSSSMKMDGSNENSKHPWIFKNLSRSFIKIFQKKTSEGILGPTPPPPTKSLPYKTFT
jgi:hypothetical protein